MHEGLVPVFKENNKILDEQMGPARLNEPDGGRIVNHLSVNLQGAAGFPLPAPSTPSFTPPDPPVVRAPVNVPMPPELVSQLRVMEVPDLHWHLPHQLQRRLGPLLGENAPGASGSASLPSAPMQVFKHVFFVGNAGQFVDGPLVGTPVPNISQNCINMQHETTLTIRSVG